MPTMAWFINTPAFSHHTTRGSLVKLPNLTQGHLGGASSTIKTPPVDRSLALKKAMMAAGAQNDLLLRFPPSGRDGSHQCRRCATVSSTGCWQRGVRHLLSGCDKKHESGRLCIIDFQLSSKAFIAVHAHVETHLILLFLPSHLGICRTRQACR